MPVPATWLIAATVAVQAWIFWPLHKPGMNAFLAPWLDTIREHGVASAFAQPLSNDMPGNLYLLARFSPLAEWVDPISIVKLLSVAGTVALALAFHRLLTALDAPQPTRWAAAICALPSVALNALHMGWCDGFYAAACVTAVAMTIERRHLAMFAWYGIALAFNAQAVLIAPFFLAIAIRGRVPFQYWLAVPAALLAMMAPALLGGWPPVDLATTYLRQASTLSVDIAHNAPNIWSLAGAIAPAYAPQLLGLALAAALGAVAAYVAQIQVVRIDKAGLAAMAALSVLLTAGLLPGMHDRYFLLAGILIFAFAITRGTRSAFALAALVQLGSTAAFIGSTEPGTPIVVVGVLCMVAATWIAAQPLIAPHANDNYDGSHRIPPPYGLRGTLSFDMMSAPVAGPRGE